jgi:hypothetical protein
LSEQITWVSQIVGADYLGLQNAGAEYLGPFFAKSGADYLGGQITFLVGQNTWAPPKVGGRIPGRGQKWGRIPGRGQKWGRLPGMIFLVFRPALLPRCRITLGAAEEEKRAKQSLKSSPPATQRDEIGMVPHLLTRTGRRAETALTLIPRRLRQHGAPA